jgi:apolipoprotein N-acyltransferase
MKHFPDRLRRRSRLAFAFAPVGLWPLMPLALASLCELVWRSKSLKQALAVGWGVRVGQFVVGLNWIATAFTYQAAMPAWLGWVAVVLLSLYLAVYPALATGLAWRFRARSRVALCSSSPGPGASPNGCAERCSPASPGIPRPRHCRRPGS